MTEMPVLLNLLPSEMESSQLTLLFVQVQTMNYVQCMCVSNWIQRRLRFHLGNLRAYAKLSVAAYLSLGEDHHRVKV